MASDGLEDAITHPVQGSDHTARPTSVSYGSVTVTDTLVIQEQGGVRITIPLSQVTSLEKVTVREDWPGIVGLILGVLAAFAWVDFVRTPDATMAVIAATLAVLSIGFLIWWSVSERCSLVIKSPTDEINVRADGMAGYDAGRLMAAVERRV